MLLVCLVKKKDRKNKWKFDLYKIENLVVDCLLDIFVLFYVYVWMKMKIKCKYVIGCL